MKKEFIKEKIKEYEKLWDKYSCDCLHFGLLYWEKQLKNNINYGFRKQR